MAAKKRQQDAYLTTPAGRRVKLRKPGTGIEGLALGPRASNALRKQRPKPKT